MMQRLSQQLDNISELINNTVPWLLLLMTLATCCIVLARYFLSLGTVFIQEAVMYGHAMVFMLGIAPTLKHNSHVRVDILYQRFSRKNQALVDLAGSLIFTLPLCAFLFFISYDYVLRAWEIKETSAEPGGMAYVYALKTLLLLTPVLLAIQCLSEMLKNLLTLKTQE